MYTLAIAWYSTTTEATFIPKFTNIAISVDIPLMRAMTNGPASLQIRSIRRICELRTTVMVKLFALIWETVAIKG